MVNLDTRNLFNVHHPRWGNRLRAHARAGPVGWEDGRSDGAGMTALIVGIVVITILVMVVRGGKVSEAQAVDLWEVREE